MTLRYTPCTIHQIPVGRRWDVESGPDGRPAIAWSTYPTQQATSLAGSTYCRAVYEALGFSVYVRRDDVAPMIWASGGDPHGIPLLHATRDEAQASAVAWHGTTRVLQYDPHRCLFLDECGTPITTVEASLWLVSGAYRVPA